MTKRNSTILALRGKPQLKLVKFRNNEVTGDILLTQIFALNGDGNGAPQTLWKRPNNAYSITSATDNLLIGIDMVVLKSSLSKVSDAPCKELRQILIRDELDPSNTTTVETCYLPDWGTVALKDFQVVDEQTISATFPIGTIEKGYKLKIVIDKV